MFLAYFALLALDVARIEPLKLYNGISRPFLIQAAGVDRLKLLEPVTAHSIAESPTRNGTVNLSSLFPELWTAPRKGVFYLQGYRGGRAVGSAIVLQPMTNPAVATYDGATKAPKFAPNEDQAFAGYRAYVDQTVRFEFSLGTIEFRMRPDAAPNTAWNMLELVRGGFYDGTIVHRIVAKGRGGLPFVVQGGDPTGTGSGGPGYAIPLEDSSLPHDFGVISMARGTDPNTAGSQWFIALSREGTARLDHKYAAFGQLVAGADVVRALAAVAVGKEDRPFRPPVLRRATLLPSPPYPEQMRPPVLR